MDIPIHDSELVYVIEEIGREKFKKLVHHLQIQLSDLKHVPFDDMQLTQEIGVDVLCRWRDKEKDSGKARATLAQCLADIDMNNQRSAYRTIETPSTKISGGNI